MSDSRSHDRLKRIREIETRLASLETERRSLLQELSTLQSSRVAANELPSLLGTPAGTQAPSSPEEKIQLFLRLFRGRESVYPKLWVNQAKGTQGYSPACRNEWVRNVCGKPQTKCSECPNQAFPSLDAEAIREHLQGKFTIGTYAIREDDTCTFLAADFDGAGWGQDAQAYRIAARELGIQAEIERSRSGEGAHVWIFFSQPVPARLARRLGTIVIARAQATRRSMGLDTYDRLFPSQDSLPKGGFGNLIALPLQKTPREQGNSVFLAENLSPHEDQWVALSAFRRLSPGDLQLVLSSQSSTHLASAVQFEDSAIASAEHALNSGSNKIVPGAFTGQIEIQVDAQLTIPTSDLPDALFSAFKRTAVFANPKFFELERMRFSTWKTPRFIFCGDIQTDRLILPRGTLDSCLELAKTSGASVLIKDHQPVYTKLEVEFKGTLSPEQKRAVSALSDHQLGVLVAPPGAGKTVMGCALIAERKTSTLVLVHRTPLMEQWQSRLAEFLGVDPKSIGLFGGTRRKKTGQIDVGMLPSFAKLENPEEALYGYGQVIIDECHHVPAFSFEAVLKKCRARYVVGLTATPYRKDGHQAIIHMQCGPTRYEIKEVDGPRLQKRVVVRETRFKMPDEAGPQPPIHLIWERLVTDQARLALVAADLKLALAAGRFPLVISERKEHLAHLAQAFARTLDISDAKGFLLVGGMGKKARAAVFREIEALRASGGRPYLLATGSLIGEGFDFPALDTLIIAMPVSFKGKLIQYAGRLHRNSAGKTDALIYDYLDSNSALTVAMYRKRLAAYRKMEYQVESEAGSSSVGRQQTELFPAKC